MKKKDYKPITITIVFLSILFGLPYLWRKSRDNDMIKNSNYTFGRITKKTGSLKSGEQWHYEFIYKNVIYKSYRSDDIGYRINEGDYFLVLFSKKNPEHNKILYEYKLGSLMLFHADYMGDTIPFSFFSH